MTMTTMTGEDTTMIRQGKKTIHRNRDKGGGNETPRTDGIQTTEMGWGRLASGSGGWGERIIHFEHDTVIAHGGGKVAGRF